MDIRNSIVKASFDSELAFDLSNRIMIGRVINQMKKEAESVVDVEKILKQHKLQIVETEFFRKKKTVARVKGMSGMHYIMKTGRIDPFQIKLLETAKSLGDKLFFKVPVIINKGKDWILLAEIEGESLNSFYDSDPNWCIKVSKLVADDYQLVIQKLKEKNNLGDLLAEGESWLYSRLNLWSKPIIDAGLINFSLVQELANDFGELINRKGDNFFGYVHGNIIGDHLIVSGGDIYLLDLNVVPRAGRGYYDFLRALDFMFLKVQDGDKNFKLIPKWMKKYLFNFDWEEVKLVFAFRCIGILGWDILYHKVKYARGNLEKKKQLILKFIKGRDY